MPPLVSVIIPNYNHAVYLKQRIDSVLDQTFTDLEVILLDDCSTDNSKNILMQYKDEPRVSAIEMNKENSGSTFFQWAKGVALAKGSYIWIAESDDYAAPTFLEETVGWMKKYPSAALCYVGSVIVDHAGGVLHSDWDKWTKKEQKSSQNYSVFDGREFALEYLIWRNYIYNASAVLFRRDLFYKIDASYQLFKYCGDHYFWSELARYGSVIKLYKKLNYFRQHTEKVSPKSERLGLQFLEGFKVFNHIDTVFHPGWYRKNSVLGRMYKRIVTFKNYEDPSIKMKVIKRYHTLYGSGIWKRWIYSFYKLINALK